MKYDSRHRQRNGGNGEPEGVGACESKVLALLVAASRKHGEHLPSMLQDVQAGQETEVEAINGSVVREAQALGMAVPTTLILYRLVRMLEHGGIGAGQDSHPTRSELQMKGYPATPARAPSNFPVISQ